MHYSYKYIVFLSFSTLIGKCKEIDSIEFALETKLNAVQTVNLYRYTVQGKLIDFALCNNH